jgi:hypothetical protein
MEAEGVRQRRQERQMLFQTVKEMQAAGLRISEIARHLGVNRRRLDKWARIDTLPERDRMQPRPEWRSPFATIYDSGGSKVAGMVGLCWPKSGNWDTSAGIRSWQSCSLRGGNRRRTRIRRQKI